MLPHMRRVRGLSLEMGWHHLGVHGIPLGRGGVLYRRILVASVEVRRALVLVGGPMLRSMLVMQLLAI